MHTVRSPQSHDQLAKLFFFFNDTATTEIYTLSLHDALPIYHAVLRILSVPDEGPDPVDHPLGLFGLPLPVRQGPQALQQIGRHTSELQSRQYLVCRLLLEKKKTISQAFILYLNTSTHACMHD